MTRYSAASGGAGLAGSRPLSSSPMSPWPVEPTEAGEVKPFLAHLEDLRHLLIRCALVMALGAAIAEFLILLPAALSTKLDKKKVTKAAERANWNAFLDERTVAFASHIAARALAWLGVGGAEGLPALGSAFGLFATTEAIQAYGQAKEWDWLNNRTLWTFLFFQIALVIVEIALIVVWWG